MRTFPLSLVALPCQLTEAGKAVEEVLEAVHWGSDDQPRLRPVITMVSGEIQPIDAE